eukprot:5008275-Pleurochrysis_carterae.AAC.1
MILWTSSSRCRAVKWPNWEDDLLFGVNMSCTERRRSKLAVQKLSLSNSLASIPFSPHPRSIVKK